MCVVGITAVCMGQFGNVFCYCAIFRGGYATGELTLVGFVCLMERELAASEYEAGIGVVF